MPRPKKIQPVRTLAEIEKEMQALKAEAEQVRITEVRDVIAKIKHAIAAYGLTPDDLFGGKAKAKKPRAKASKPHSPAKYRDPATGKTWTGHGKRPGWFVAALESGADEKALSI